jgi:hypothetical protein
MRPADYLSGHSAVPAVNMRAHAPDDDTITRFLATSALYFKLSAERLANASNPQTSTDKSKEQS